MKKQLQEQYGWMFLAKQVADYCNDTFKNVLEYSAMEVMSLVMVIRAENELNKLSTTNAKANT